MTKPNFVTFNTGFLNSGTSFNLKVPAVANGDPADTNGQDFMALFVIGQNTAIVSKPAGWNDFAGSVFPIDAPAARLSAFWKTAAGSSGGASSELNNNVTVAYDVSNKCAAGIYVARAVDPGNSVDDAKTRAESSSGTSHDCPAATAAVAEDLVVVVEGERGTNVSTTQTPPSGFTSRFQVATSSSGGTSLAVADDAATVNSSGSLDPASWTNGPNATTGAATATILLRPIIVSAGGQFVFNYAAIIG